MAKLNNDSVKKNIDIDPMSGFDSDLHIKISGGFQAKDASKRIAKITVGAFRRRLTLDEKIALKTSSDPAIQVFNDDLAALTYIDINDGELQSALAYAASVNLLSLADGQTNDERISELLAQGTQEEAA